MSTDQIPIPITGLKRGTTQSAYELHITGGIRAVLNNRLWSWFPVLEASKLGRLRPLPINKVAELAKDIGAELFGGDQLSGMETSLVSRAWTPLDGPHDGGLQPADLWRAIAGNAESAGDKKYASFAQHIAFSLSAAGIRLRDASDHYRDQLHAAIEEKRLPGKRFSNIPIYDLQLAFHSVLSELASARDYLAAAIAAKLGAPDRIDALNRFSEWVRASSRSEMRVLPVVEQMLQAYDQAGSDPWLHQLTEYRNMFLHHKPLGASDAARWLRYDERERSGIIYPIIELPLGDADPSAPGRDALIRFVELYRHMTNLLSLAASHAPYDTSLPHFVAR